MANMPINETVLHVETALAAVGFGEGMIQLAEQFRREGNHPAANGALMMAWIIKENTEDAMAILDGVRREHAALLGQSERQRLVTDLNASWENLDRLGREHESTEDQWDECYEKESEWYQLCFEVSHATHLAHAITAYAEGQARSEDNVELVVDAVSKCYEGAQESLEDARKNEPPADASFPQIRQQHMEKALTDLANLGRLNQKLREMLKTVEKEADNSLGQCHLCGIAVRADDASDHARSCVSAAFQRMEYKNGLDSRRGEKGTMMFWVRGDEVRTWMMLAVRSDTSLLQLDHFLRNVWLECCGHMSRFDIGGALYGGPVRSSGRTSILGDGLTEPDQRHMMYRVQEIVAPGELFRHEYDYDCIWSTSLDLECVAVPSGPYDYLRELISPPQSAEGHPDDFVTIVARNLPLEVCFTCGEPARWYYYENPYAQIPRENGGATGLPPYFCDDCAPRNALLVEIRNSPRYGVHCYDSLYDRPVHHPEPHAYDPT